MTPDELVAVEARATAATPGPWTWSAPEAWKGKRIVCGALKNEYEDQYVVAELHGFHNTDGVAVFIAAARSDVPALCQEVRRLTEQNEALRYELNPSDSWTRDAQDIARLKSERNSARAERDAERRRGDAHEQSIIRLEEQRDVLRAENEGLDGLLRDRDEREDALNDEVAVLRGVIAAITALRDQTDARAVGRGSMRVATSAIRAVLPPREAQK